jgi:hypothetical protein
MNIFDTWKSFQRPVRRVQIHAHRLYPIAQCLTKYNERRESIQKKIFILTNNIDICSECQGACCRGNYNHFTAIDYFIRCFSENPIKEYGALWKPEPAASVFFKKLLSTFKASESDLKALNTACSQLTSNGCKLKPEHRPIFCVLWTCKKFRNSCPNQIITELGRLTRELDEIVSEVASIFRISKKLNR